MDEKNRETHRLTVLRIGPNFINFWLIAVSLIIAITPELGRNFPKIIWVLLIALWYIAVVLKGYFRKSCTGRFVPFIFIWTLYILLLRLIGYSSAAIGNYFLIIVSFDIVIKTFYVIECFTTSEKKKLFRLIQIVVLINLIQNIILGINEPKAFYYIFVFPEQYVGKNVAVTQFYEMLAYFIGLNAFLLFHEKNRALRIIEVISIFLSYFFMITFEPRTTAIFLSIVLLVMIFLSQFRSVSNKIIVVMVSFILLFLFLIFFHESIISLFPDRIAVRLNAVLNFTTTSYSSVGELRRFELQLNSIKTFLSSPNTILLGAGFHLGTDYSGIIGQHAMFTDYLAAYGLLGLWFMYSFFTKAWKILIYRLKCEKSYIKCCFITILVSCVLTNPIRPEVLPLSVLLPGIITCVTKQREREAY